MTMMMMMMMMMMTKTMFKRHDFECENSPMLLFGTLLPPPDKKCFFMFL